jgi:simple sugar transport system permease protein
MNGRRYTIGDLMKRQESVLFLILFAYCSFVSIVNPTFLALDNIFDIVKSSAGMMVLAMGVLVVLVSGGIDVSFTAMAIFSGYITIRIMIAFGIDSLFLAFLASAFIGLFLGFLNGIIVHKFRLRPLIVTLGTQNIFIGALSVLFGTKFIPVGQMPKSIVRFGTNSLLSIPLSSGGTANLTLFLVPVALVVLVTWFILNRTMLGKSVYALGSSPVAAQRAGLNIASIRYFVYSYMGVLAGIMGIIYAAEVRSLNPISLVGEELTIIAATVLGGAKLTGGRGTVLGTFFGVLIISVLNTTLILIGLSSSWNNFFVGIIILLSVGITAFRNKKESEKNLIFL